MNINNKLKVSYRYYSSLTTPELEKILKLDFFASDEELSPETINIILNILKSRENTEKNEFNVDKSWDSFISNYLPFVEKNSSIFDSPNTIPIKTKIKETFYKKRNLAAVLVMSIIIFNAFSTTTPAQDLFSYIANWTKEIFWFNNDNASADYDQSTLKLDLENNYNFTNIPDNLLPTRIPEGFIEKSVDSYENSSEKVVYILFENEKEDSFFSITISQLLTDITKIYEKDDLEVVIYQKNGSDYYLMNNLNTSTAIWKNGVFECQIDGTITVKELKEIINSIPNI